MQVEPNPAAPRKLPELEPLTAAFWTGGEHGKLRIQHCGDCGHWQHPPLARCPKCHGANLSADAVSGRGRVQTFTINHQAWIKGVDPRFVFAVIALDEQPELYVFSNVLADPERMRSGMQVEVCFERNDDVWIPLFRPVGES
ncbi:MAG: OB-fold domain-containing protein [Sphingomonadales bacterium]|nr:OB-fold domain-containing protein [Sphingomonadales bacterium]